MIRAIITYMPYCKNCHTRIDKFNKDRCPICGEVDPFDGISSDTIEITTNIDTSSIGELDYHPRTRKALWIYFSTLGIFGVPFFYMYRKLAGFIYASINLALLAGLILIFALAAHLHIAASIAIAVAIMYLLNFLLGLYYYHKPNLKDGHGEFLN